MKTAYVYKITSPTGRTYVGSTINKERRFKEYLKGYIPYQHKLRSSFDKHGFANHIIEILWSGSQEEMLSKEAEYGHFYNVLDRKLGLNLKLPKLDEVSISYSEETLEKMRLARKGMSALWNNELVSLYDLQGNYLKTLNSFLDCAKELNCSRELVCSIVSGRTKTFKKTFLIKKGNSKSKTDLPTERKGRNDKGVSKEKNKKKILCIQDNKIFDSVSEAALHYNLSTTSISNILHGRAKTTNNGKSFLAI